MLQPLLAQYNWAELESDLKLKQKSLGTDLSVMIWKHGDTLVYKKDLGIFNSKTSAPVGDASRWFTAALVMQFVDEGKLSLDDRISQWVPEFARYGKNYITLRHCLSHYTGVEDGDRLMRRMFQKKKDGSLEELVNSYASREIRTNPGTDAWYGDIGPNIAGRVLEVISKKRFDVLIKQKLFNPMTMRRTSFTSLDGMLVNPSNGASASAEDYIKFMVMLMNKGIYAGKQILSEASVDELLKLQVTADKLKFAPKPAAGLGYALGSWIIEEQAGKPAAYSSLGFKGAWPVIDLCRGYACIILSKETLDEEGQRVYTDLKKHIDTQMASTCD
jgi:CubicO group peptidase (beta-lactamase class C family)